MLQTLYFLPFPHLSQPFKTCWKSIINTISPWHHRTNTSCSWPYVCVSWADGSAVLLPDWINFRCAVCLDLLQRLCCDFEPQAWALPAPPIPLATVPPLSSFTPPRRPALFTRHLPAPHTRRSATDTLTHMPLLMPPNSHIPCVSCTVMECLKKTSIPPSTPSVSLCFVFLSPEGSSQTESL